MILSKHVFQTETFAKLSIVITAQAVTHFQSQIDF